MRAQLDPEDIEQIALRVVELLAERLNLPGAPEWQLAREWMNTGEAAAYLGLSANTLHKLSSARQIPFSQHKPGGRLFFRRADLDAWRASQGHGDLGRDE